MPISTWTVAVLVMLLVGAMTFGEATVDRDGETLKKITVVTGAGKGKLEINHKLWSNTIVWTEGGKSFRFIDPFFYSATTRKADGTKGGGYWNKPENFAKWHVEQIKDPARPDTDILKITAAPEGHFLKKEVTIAIDKGENIAYVYNRITALEDLASAYDRQTMYLYKPAKWYVITVDGKVITPQPKGKVKVQESLLFQSTRDATSGAVVFLPRDKQSYPRSATRQLGQILFYIDGKRDGADCFWDKNSGKMAKGATRVQQYIIVWGDGDLTERIADLSKKAQAGELNDKVHVLK